MIARKKHLPKDSEAGAIWWATRRQSDPERFAHDERFEAWLADPANACAWEDVQSRDALIGSFAAGPEIRQMRHDALAYARAARPRRRYWLVGGALAASLAAGVISFGTSDMMSPAPAFEIAQTDQVERFATAKGERREFTLSDGSRIALNTSTIVEAQFGPERRDIRLLSGQALFHVAKDKARPFVVAAGSRLITATGTAFDVEVEKDGDVKVLLVEGRVRIDPVQPKGLSRLIPAFSREDLRPGQEYIASHVGSSILTVADIEQGTAWNRGLIILRDDSISDAIAQFNRYSDKPMVVENQGIGELKVSGVFPTAKREDFVDALELMHPVEASEQATSVVLKWRNSRSTGRP